MSGPPNKWYATPLPDDFTMADIEALLNAYSTTNPTTAAFIAYCPGDKKTVLFQANYNQ